jgi:NAD(P)-dependent dehydrogenase (short-subunit alcohol dehydrogenase family)
MSAAGARVAVVTGAAGAIGAAVTARLAADGLAVAAVDCDGAGAERVAAGVPGAVAFGCDVSRADDVTALRAAVERAPGAPDVLVNVAGVFFEHDVPTLADDEWERLIGANLTGTFLTCRAFLPAMIAAGSGCIVNVASTAGLRGGHRRAAYCAAKGGVVLLSRSLALDHGPQGVRVNCLCPGLIDTPMADWIRLDADRLRAWEETVPARRIGTPEDIAAAASFLASPAADYLHGATLVVDGGATA